MFGEIANLIIKQQSGYYFSKAQHRHTNAITHMTPMHTGLNYIKLQVIVNMHTGLNYIKITGTVMNSSYFVWPFI